MSEGGGPGVSGPGWVLQYIETLMAEHHLPLPFILGSDPAHFLPVDTGLALLNARRERLHPGSVPSYAAGAIAAARKAEKERCLAHNAGLKKEVPHG